MSFQIFDFNFANKSICLSKKTNNSESHTFTIITGKNAVGKSRLLASIVINYLTQPGSHTLFGNNPDKIIAISNIINDKFPLKKDKTKNYAYIGSKTIQMYPSSFRSERFFIFKSLLINRDLNRDSLSSTFNYLGFFPKFKLKFSFQTAYNKIVEPNTYGEIIERYNKFFSDRFIFFSKNMQDLIKLVSNNIDISEYKILDNLPKKIDTFIKKINNNELLLLKFLSKTYNQQKKITALNFNYGFELFISSRTHEKIREFNFNFNFTDNYYIDDILYLIELDFIRIQEVYLYKNNTIEDSFVNEDSLEEVNFNDISSGQQSLFNIFFGISSVIDNNSLICIDEPEVNLHPSWQTELILKLQSIFKNYTGCHFIIATHSPQIVSGLKSDHGYVVDLENNITYESKEYSTRSADFQLAKIFNSPGYNNEYIIKICLYILSKIKDKENLNNNDISNLNDLKIFSSTLRTDDPVYYLVKEVISLTGE
ncbi:AAA family ATPase [Acinetobacter baumannii]|uniref:AAA family ATPase n=1 Tax=Acinetobacter baumannii TaxID=470 RepID=UPI0023AB384B|nr:AAA family ATPase [Acinetobacter baumannii]MDE5409331.1 AAA family ATPase [Acinetobacter baumannii]MDV7589328.1 AAA family ATPase [Acinetobacter baumannii]HCA5151360.1 ATP-binding protein [Acinetobacter baumannii]